MTSWKENEWSRMYWRDRYRRDLVPKNKYIQEGMQIFVFSLTFSAVQLKNKNRYIEWIDGW